MTLKTACFSFTLISLLLVVGSCERRTAPGTPDRVEALLKEMTLEEKVGQLNFLVGDLFNTGPTVRTSESAKFDNLIRQGRITGLFNVHGAAYTARLQRIAMEESRLKIPLLFGADIIHGFKTVMPLPLAEAASWDLQTIESSARVAALESTAAGINLTFAPMVDISRDARWGRISEGAGEDPFLGAEIARARVRGFQGQSLADPATMAACLKHFAAYGAPVAGRDYNTVDISERELRETYLPPFQAGLEAGAASVMTGFHELNGIPATGNRLLLETILRAEWGFDGVVMSDWQSIGEMIAHGYTEDSVAAAQRSLQAGTDVDMMAEIYLRKLPAMVRSGLVSEKVLDDAVRRVLILKWQLGLFDDPYRYSDTTREKQTIRSAENLAVARDMARKSIVLLKNKDRLLPLGKHYKRIALVGPLADNKEELNGSWSFFGEPQHPVSIREGLQVALPGTQFVYAEGSGLYSQEDDSMEEAVRAARTSDLVIVVVGESAVMNGEAGSRSVLGLPGRQQQLVEAIHATGKPVIVLLVNGRPLALPWIDANIPAIVECWTLGSETGHAVADVLTGAYNPSGKLPVTFPRNEGQVPIYYNHKNTGRPYLGDNSEPETERVYRSKYRDVPNTPLYPFGYGLSYSTFAYGELQLNHDAMSAYDSIGVTVSVRNTSDTPGEEVVQLYVQDHFGSVTRPVRELKAFRKIALGAGESRTVTFFITARMLSFYRSDNTWGPEPGTFTAYVGGNSRDTQRVDFRLTPSR